MQDLNTGRRHLVALAGNSGWSVLVQLVRTGALLIVAILLARYLGPTVFGVFAVAFSVVRIFSVLAGFGLDRILVKRIVRGGGASLVRQVLMIRVMGGLLAYGLAVGTAALLERWTAGVLGLVIVMGPVLVLQATNTFAIAFQAESRMRLTAIATTPPLVISAVVKIVAMASGAPLMAFAWFELLEGFLLAAGLLATYVASGREERGPAKESRTVSSRSLLVEAFPLLLSSLGVIAYMRSDVLMLGVLRGSESVGIFSAAAQLSEVWSLLPVALMPAVLPFLLKMRERDPAAYHQALSLLYGVAAIGAIVISSIVTLLAPWLVSLLFGDSYLGSIPVLRVHVWSAVFIYLGVAQSIWDIGENRLWLSFMRTGSGAVINVALNLVLIPRYGPLGAAIATVISQATSAVLLNAVSPHTRGVLRLQLQALLIVPTLVRLRHGIPAMRETVL